VKSFYKYYPLLGVPIPNEEALQQRLRQAIENSRKKKYHGNEKDINELPSLEEQAKEFLELKVKPLEFFNSETNEFLPADSPKWQQAVLDKFYWIRQLHQNSAASEDNQLLPRDYALMNDDEAIETKDLNKRKEKFD